MSDETIEVRDGQSIDPEALRSALGLTGPIEIRQFGKGHSNLTYLVVTPEAELVLRRSPPGVEIAGAHDMAREFRILSGLSKVYHRVPRPVSLCEDPSVLGTPFFVMEWVQGIILRPRQECPDIEWTPSLVRGLHEAFVDNLASIHAIDLEAAGLADLAREGSYVDRQIEGWTRRSWRAQIEENPEIETVAAWLAEQRPADVGQVLIHNDYKLDNVILDPDDPTNLVAVLDWEMATVGDPLMDLGTTLGYWVQGDDPPSLKFLGLSPPVHPGTLTRREVADLYAEASGRDVSDILYYYVFGLFKITVIAQQLYARFQRGQSTDRRLAAMGEPVRLLARTAVKAIERGRIDRMT